MKRCVCKTLLSFFQQFKDAPPVAKFLLLSSELSNYSFLPFSSSSFLKLDFPKTHLLLPLCIRTNRLWFSPLTPKSEGESYHISWPHWGNPTPCIVFWLQPCTCLPPSLIPCVFPLCSFWFSPPLSFPYSGALITATAREKKQKPNIRKGENGVGLVFFFCPSGFFPFLDPGIRQIGFVTLNRLFFLFFIFFWGGVPRSPFRAHWIKIEFWGGWRRRKKRVFSDPPLPDCS